MARPQDADGGEGLQILRVAANISVSVIEMTSYLSYVFI
jgi:hypothetical protein